VTVIGGGVVGLNAARMAIGLGAQVSILDKSLVRLKQIDDRYSGRITTLYSTSEVLEQQIVQADAVIGAVLIPGAAAPKLVTEAMVARMKQGSVLVDVAIDQGGCFATSRPTTHQHPTFIQHGVVHYCVANMPGAVARTATQALTNATLPYVLALAREGLAACRSVPGLMTGLNVLGGRITHAAVAEALGLEFHDPRQFLPS
jgi:alanine dehydrogenase